jgi:type IV pilus assembly protein PilQ
VLSKRGSVVPDERSNKIFVNDVPRAWKSAPPHRRDRRRGAPGADRSADRRGDRHLHPQPGVRLGFGAKTGGLLGTTDGGVSVYRNTFGSGSLTSTGYQAGQISTVPNFTDSLAVNLPASTINGKQAGAFSWPSGTVRPPASSTWKSRPSRPMAGQGRLPPRVMTADKVEAIIEQGTEVPFQTQGGGTTAPTVSFKKANLALKVKPQITPDGKVMMSIEVNKDQPRYDRRWRTAMSPSTPSTSRPKSWWKMVAPS